MKGKKLVFAVILSLIVCLLLVPSAFAEEITTENNSENEFVATNNGTSDGDNGGSNNDSQNNESTDYSDDSGDDNSENNDSTSKDEEQSGDNASDSDTDKNENGGGNSDLGDNSDKDKNTNGEDESTDDDDTGDDDASDNENNNANEDGEDESNSENDTDSSSNPNSDSGATPPQPEKKGFQVELTYNGKVYKMDGLMGGESHDLVQIVKELGIDGEIESASGNADELFDTTKCEDGWKLNTKSAFNTKQELTLVVNGIEYKIKVTDANVETVDSVDGLIDAIKGDAQTIIIGKDFDIDKTVEIAANKIITIDLNGKTLTNKVNSAIVNYGEFTLADNSSAKNGKIVNTVVGGYVIINAGKATLNGGTIESGINNRHITNLGTMEINDGFTLSKTGGGWACIQNGWKNSGEFKSIASYGTTPATLTVNGGIFNVSDGANVIKNDDYGTLVINGGTFNGGNYVVQNSGKKTTINGGSFTSGDICAVIQSSVKRTSEINTGELEINGGIFANNNLIKFSNSKRADTDIAINGGLYVNDKVEEYLTENEILVKCGALYAVNESGYEFAKSGNTVEIVKAPEGAKIDDVPGGVTVVNGTGAPITVNGVILAPGESYTIAPASTVSYTEAPVIKYWVVEGKDQEWTKNSGESLMFTLNSNGVVKVLLDGEEVDFELNENGEIVISAEVLEALEAGEHEIEFVFADGSCKTDIFVK